MIKTYVLDTNILLQSPASIFGFDDNEVIITGTTLQELDHKKNVAGEPGYNARETIRLIESLRERGDLRSGIQLPGGGAFKIVTDAVLDKLPDGYSLDVPDNRIINTALSLSKTAILITNDISMRVNASICGLKVEGYLNETIKGGLNYTGRAKQSVCDSIIDQLYTDKKIVCPDDIKNPVENQYFLLTGTEKQNKSALTVYQNGLVSLIEDKKLRGWGEIHGKNVPQKFLMHALLAPAEEIPLVIAIGPAGTGKTMLSIACGLEGTYDQKEERRYQNVMITRTNTLSDRDMGFLPGTMEEKMEPLIAPFKDNMEQIFGGKEKDRELATQQIEMVLSKGIVEIFPVAYMRGRSLTEKYLIVDEAQNLSVGQALEIISRAGRGTKIVLCGDPDQIDDPHLDKNNNGLVFAAERMKGSPLCAQVRFDQKEAVRSPLAMEAAKRLTVK